MRFPFWKKKSAYIVTEMRSDVHDAKMMSVHLYVGGNTKKCEVEVVIDITDRIGAPRELKTVIFKDNGYQVVIDGALYEISNEYNGNPFNGIDLDVPMQLSYYVPAEKTINYINGDIVKVRFKK